MASCSTSSSLSGNSLPELLSKRRSSEFGSYEASFLNGNLATKYDDSISTDLKSLAANDKKLRELLSFFEPQKEINAFKRTFPKQVAEEEAKEDSEKEDSEEGDSNTGDSEDVLENEIQVMVIPTSTLLEPKAALTKLEFLSFVFTIWLRRIQLTRKEDQDKNNSFRDFEHAIYNAQEVIKHFKDFIFKQCYNREELQQMLPYHEDLLEKASRKTFEEKDKASFEMLEDDVVRLCSNRARVCASLGLQLDFLDCLEEISPEDRDHLTLCDWIVSFLANDYESIPSTDNKELLAATGFDPLSSAVETIMARAGNTQQHIETCEMAELFIKDEFKYNVLLSPLVDRFPFQSNLTNTWFQLPRDIDEKGKETNKELCHINIMNVVTNESNVSTLTQSKLSDLVVEDDQNVVLLHGTDHKSARDILFRGIDLRAGRQKRDFSCGSGFYLTSRNKFDDALNWAKNTTTKPAVLIFQVNRREHLDDARKLSLHGNEGRWREIVSSFRSCKRTAKTRKSLSGYDLIEGPAATITRSESGELVIEPKPSSYQMCLISDDFAHNFRQTLHSVMFLDVS